MFSLTLEIPNFQLNYCSYIYISKCRELVFIAFCSGIACLHKDPSCKSKMTIICVLHKKGDLGAYKQTKQTEPLIKIIVLDCMNQIESLLRACHKCKFRHRK